MHRQCLQWEDKNKVEIGEKRYVHAKVTRKRKDRYDTLEQHKIGLEREVHKTRHRADKALSFLSYSQCYSLHSCAALSPFSLLKNEPGDHPTYWRRLPRKRFQWNPLLEPMRDTHSSSCPLHNILLEFFDSRPLCIFICEDNRSAFLLFSSKSLAESSYSFPLLVLCCKRLQWLSFSVC